MVGDESELLTEGKEASEHHTISVRVLLRLEEVEDRSQKLPLAPKVALDLYVVEVVLPKSHAFFSVAVRHFDIRVHEVLKCSVFFLIGVAFPSDLKDNLDEPEEVDGLAFVPFAEHKVGAGSPILGLNQAALLGEFHEVAEFQGIDFQVAVDGSVVLEHALQPT